ncbi:hypothetical protein [Demequina sp. NBRC 110051]|uniref:hypothetical protein n=1 Tax=Demequina sp. NBRC 110051 TaxID=1570340 RepID=UPI000A04C216|nr:hypothetical protein [Demequina sp. NBRC 110051]
MVQYVPKGGPKGGPKAAWALPGFDQEAFDASPVAKSIARMKAIYLAHQDDPMHPEVVDYWKRQGVRKELFEADGEGRYAVFTPLDLAPGHEYALVYSSHGGKEPINRAETNGWAALAARENLIVVYPWNGGPSNDLVETEFPRIVTQMREAGYPIDTSRIYAVGYSAGSDATGVLACAHPATLAAASPSPGGNLFAKGRWYSDPSSYVNNAAVRLPIVCVAGTMDGGDVYPLRESEHIENFNIWMRGIAKVRDFTPLTLERSQEIVATSDDPAERAFGFEFHRTSHLRREGMDWVCGEFLGDEGYPVARFIAGVGLPHAETASHPIFIWDFIRHFRRDPATGESVRALDVLDGMTPPEVVTA